MKLQERRKVASWVIAARDGSGEALDALARFYTGRLGRIFGRRLADPFLAEDLVQETLMLGLAGLGRLRNPLCFDAYICRIGRRLAVNTFRGRRPLPCDPRYLALLEESGGCRPLGLSRAACFPVEEAVNTALGYLAPEERLLVREHHGLGQPLSSMALRHGLKLSALKMRLLRARRRLEPILARVLADPERLEAACGPSGINGKRTRDRLPGHPVARRCEG